MASLVAVLSSGKGTWTQVLELIKITPWEQVFLICNDFTYKNFNINSDKISKILINENNEEEIFSELSNIFKKQIKDFEVAINITSGSGIEHMAIISALLKAGVGLRFVYIKDQKLQEFKLLEEDYSILNKENNENY